MNRSRQVWARACWLGLLLSAILGAQEGTQKRDLKIVPDDTPPVEGLAKADGTPVTISAQLRAGGGRGGLQESAG